MPARLLYTKTQKNESVFMVIAHLVLVVSNFLREFLVKVLLVQCGLAVIVDLLQPLVHQKGGCYIKKRHIDISARLVSIRDSMTDVSRCL